MSLALVVVVKNIKNVVVQINLNTIFKKLDKKNINEYKAVLKKAANILKNEGLVAFPTETVYGLGANAFSANATDKIFLAKNRPKDNPLIIHIANIEDAKKLAYIPPIAHDLMQKFWPGALTLVLKSKNILPTQNITLNTIAIRMPKNDIALDLMKYCAFPIAAPSANLSGSPSPTKAEHVVNDLNGKIDMILDGGSCTFGLESTVVQILEDKLIILRPGSVTKNMLKEVCQNILIDNSTLNINALPKAPGMKYKHYAPKGQMVIIKGSLFNKAKQILSLLQKNENSVAIISSEMINHFPEFENYNTLNIGSVNDMQIIAQNLFDILRKCDLLNFEHIYIEYFAEEEIGLAIMNRIKKAACYNIINV